MVDTNDVDDIDRQEIQRHMRNDMPVKMKDNRPFIDDVNSYDRDRDVINRSFNDRISLGQTSLMGAQQVTAIDKHTDQRTYIPNYLRQLRTGKNERNIHSDIQDMRKYNIPQVDGIVDSNTSLSMTTDSIDLTVSPLKRKTSTTDKNNRGVDVSNDNIDQLHTENSRQTRASKKNKGIGKTSARAKLNKAQATQLKDCATKGQELKDDKAQTKDNQTEPYTTKDRVFKTYEIDQEKKELLRQR